MPDCEGVGTSDVEAEAFNVRVRLFVRLACVEEGDPDALSRSVLEALRECVVGEKVRDLPTVSEELRPSVGDSSDADMSRVSDTDPL